METKLYESNVLSDIRLISTDETGKNFKYVVGLKELCYYREIYWRSGKIEDLLTLKKLFFLDVNNITEESMSFVKDMENEIEEKFPNLFDEIILIIEQIENLKFSENENEKINILLYYNNNKKNIFVTEILYYDIHWYMIYYKSSKHKHLAGNLVIKYKMSHPDYFGPVKDNGGVQITSSEKFNYNLKLQKKIMFYYRDLIALSFQNITNFHFITGLNNSNEFSFSLISDEIKYKQIKNCVVIQKAGLHLDSANIIGNILGIYKNNDIINLIKHSSFRIDYKESDSLSSLFERKTFGNRINLAIFEDNFTEDLILNEEIRKIYISPKVSKTNSLKIKELAIKKQIEIVEDLEINYYSNSVYDVVFAINSDLNQKYMTLITPLIHFTNGIIIEIDDKFENTVDTLIKDKNEGNLNNLNPNKYLLINLNESNSFVTSQITISTEYLLEKLFTFLFYFLIKNKETIEKRKSTSLLDYCLNIFKSYNLLDSILKIESFSELSRLDFITYIQQIKPFVLKEYKILSKLLSIELWNYNITVNKNKEQLFVYNLDEVNVPSWTVFDENIDKSYLDSVIFHSLIYSSQILTFKPLNEVNQYKFGDAFSKKDDFYDYANKIKENILDDKIFSFLNEINMYLPYSRLINDFDNKKTIDGYADAEMSCGIISIFSVNRSIFLELSLGIYNYHRFSFGRCLVGESKDTLLFNYKSISKQGVWWYNKSELALVHEIADIENNELSFSVVKKGLKAMVLENLSIKQFKILKNKNKKSSTLILDELLKSDMVFMFAHGKQDSLQLRHSKKVVLDITKDEIIHSKIHQRNPLIYINACSVANINTIDKNNLNNNYYLSITEAFLKIGAINVIAPIINVDLWDILFPQIEFIKYICLGKSFASVMRLIRWRLWNEDNINYHYYILYGDPHLKFFKFSERKGIKFISEFKKQEKRVVDFLNKLKYTSF